MFCTNLTQELLATGDYNFVKATDSEFSVRGSRHKEPIIFPMLLLPLALTFIAPATQSVMGRSIIQIDNYFNMVFLPFLKKPGIEPEFLQYSGPGIVNSAPGIFLKL